MTKKQLLLDAADDCESEANNLLNQAPNMGLTKERKYRVEADACIARAKALREWSAELSVEPTSANRLLYALRIIRFSGRNEHPTAVWMQKVAAHAMEPNQWPEQSAEPPEDEPTLAQQLEARGFKPHGDTQRLRSRKVSVEPEVPQFDIDSIERIARQQDVFGGRDGNTVTITGPIVISGPAARTS